MTERQKQKKEWYEKNKSRISKQSKKRYQNNKQYVRERTLKKLYNLTLEQWQTLLESQFNRCKICKTDSPGLKGWATDHCHTTGKVRGILCNFCNTGLGLFKDNILILQEAIKYLEVSRG
jgi:hypothetical protein